MGTFVYHLVPIRKSVARQHIQNAFPAYGNRTVERVLKDSYISLSRTFLEILKLPQLDRETLLGLVTVNGKEHLDHALEGGKGLIVVTYHIGNWELMGVVSVLMGYPLDVIVQRQSNPLSDALINSLRLGAGIGVIERRQAVSKSIRALKKNRIVAFLTDQDAHEEGIFAPLFGKLASTPRGPAVLALRLKVPIVTTVILREKDGTHRFIIRPLEVNASGNTEEDVYTIVCEINKRLEEYVREKPEQWLWHHRRWKTRPNETMMQLAEKG